MLLHRIHSYAMRLLYLVLTPRHPRAWIDMHAVFEDDGSRLWIHSHGMNRWGLRDVEFVGVPCEFRGYAHGLLFELTGYMKLAKPIKADEHIGGLLVHDHQKVPHFTTSRLVNRPEDPAHSGFLRFVDYKQPLESGFPRRLFAVHVGSLAEKTRSPARREILFRESLRIDCGDNSLQEPNPETNPGNWLAWNGLGNALCDLGRVDEGLQCLGEVVNRCPAVAAHMHESVVKGIAAGRVPPPTVDPRSRFWSGLDAEQLRARVAALQDSTD